MNLLKCAKNSEPMSKFLSRSVLVGSLILRPPPNGNLGFLGNPNVFQFRWLSNSSEQQSFTVSYLINSLGFSPEAALSASRYVNFETPEKPDKLVHFFTKYGFTRDQISNIVRIHPRTLGYNAEKTFLPKLKFFEAKGISRQEMAKVLSVFPSVLRCSLVKQIIPRYDFVRNFFQSDAIAIAAVKRYPNILTSNVDKYVVPNIDILREHKVSDSNIATLFKNWPKSIMVSSVKFRRVVEEVQEMGFDASKGSFVLAVNAFRSMSKSIWEKKADAYKKWGWSREEVLKAFQGNPSCMKLSEDKIVACMDFFINEMGWTPSLVARCPTILTLSLEKRVVPRCSVFQVLLSKGFVEKKVSINSLLLVTEKKFLLRFIVPYEKKAPELRKLYKEKMGSSRGSNDEGDKDLRNTSKRVR